MMNLPEKSDELISTLLTASLKHYLLKKRQKNHHLTNLQKFVQWIRKISFEFFLKWKNIHDEFTWQVFSYR